MYKYTDQKRKRKNNKGEKSLCKSALGQYRQYVDDISIDGTFKICIYLQKYLKDLIWHIQ